MRNLQSEEDVTEMLASERAVLFVFVSWSGYASGGRELVKEAGTQFATARSNRSVTWWMGDFSSTYSIVSSLVHQWLTEQERRQAFHLFPNIALGHGSVVWMNRGEIINFADSAKRLGLKSILQRTEDLFR